MTDQLDDLFRDLRAETLTTVRPPGSAAARSTLRRRRRNRAAGAAACLAVAGIGGVGTHLLGPVRTPDVGDRPFRAAAAIGATAGARFSGQGAAGTATVAQGRVLKGHYTITLSCVGSGRLSLSVQVGGGELAEATVWCGSGTGVAKRDFTLPDTLTVTAELRAEHGAAGRAGYAYTMVMVDGERDDLVRAAAAALPAAGSGTLVTTWDYDAVVATTNRHALAPGIYRLAQSCAGIGRVTVLLPPSAAPAEMAVDCGGPATDDTFAVESGGTVEFDIVPDADADHQSAYAVRLERVG